ncbi:hypothetical protein J4N42_05815 [Vibrio sp. SCSIO 43135]|uniref:hypothetical protein n=1 Tax=Vibrio sp. SCSIO 43135 TaxID=2819096 RepID=UPI0020754B95|nr:hypothetical protein [Vibrio sp. SCSIO 43135]USD42239.1 hypothetical protein J4N42_05815 [Vibrio sp. SCSIO 43135]
MASKISSAIQLLLALSIFYLGYTIHGMTSKVGEVIDTYPKILEDVSTLSKHLQIEEWLEVADTLEDLLPDIIRSVEEVTVAVSDTNKTAASIDAKIPMIVGEVTQYREVLVPAVLAEAQQYRVDVIPPVLVESKGYRNETIPLVVKESEALRQDIPPILLKADEVALKADQIVEKSQDIAQQATQGAVKGVILSPLDLIRDAGNELKGRVTPAEGAEP